VKILCLLSTGKLVRQEKSKESKIIEKTITQVKEKQGRTGELYLGLTNNLGR